MDPAPADPAATSSSPNTHTETPPCPSWCVRDHADQDPADQLHEGHTRLVGAITLERSPGEAPNSIARRAVATALAITRTVIKCGLTRECLPTGCLQISLIEVKHSRMHYPWGWVF